MLFVLEATGMLVNRVSSEWYVSPGGPQAHCSDYRPVRRPLPLTSGVAGVVSRLTAAARRFIERRAVIRELSTKDDRLLADIGISRDQIEAVAEAAASRGPDHATRLLSAQAWVRVPGRDSARAANDNDHRFAA